MPQIEVQIWRQLVYRESEILALKPQVEVGPVARSVGSRLAECHMSLMVNRHLHLSLHVIAHQALLPEIEVIVNNSELRQETLIPHPGG